MNRNEQKDQGKAIANHIFSGSITMIGVCITIIALFRAFKTGAETFADNILGADTFIFIIAALLSYTALKNDSYKRIERFADILFFTGMLSMLVVGVIILYSTA